MIEKSPPILGKIMVVEHEPHPTHEVRPAWFKEFMVGINRFPQANREGIDSLLTASVLNERPTRWSEFADSQLSDKQLQVVTGAMDGSHAGVGVRYSSQSPYPADAPLHKKVISKLKFEGRYHVPQSRLQDIWHGAVDETERVILGYLDRRHYSSSYIPKALQVGKIESLVTDPRYAKRLSTLQRTMDLVAAAVKSEKGKQISDAYKAAEAVRLKEESGKCLYDIKEHVLTNVRTEFPHEDLEWLYGKWQMPKR